MHAVIKVQMDNAAFQDDPGELSRILGDLAIKLSHETAFISVGYARPLLDVNGNKVGFLEIKKG
jgi:hypothetical protein